MFGHSGPVPVFDGLAFESPRNVKTVQNSDGTFYEAVRLYNATGGALTAGRPYIVTYDGDEETNPQVIAASAAIAFPVWQVIAEAATAAASWGWFAWRGVVPTVAILGTTGIKDDWFHISGAAPTGLTETGTSRNATSIAILTETANPAGNYRAILIGERAQVAA